MTTERPILFSAPMVRAILAGTKTQTRRALAPDLFISSGGAVVRMKSAVAGVTGISEAHCPYWRAPGDRLWVRETHMDLGACYLYRADPGAETERALVAHGQRWKPAIHMARAASRILLEVTGVRVERLQAISEADARAEGAPSADLVSGRECIFPHQGLHRWGFQLLWQQINGLDSWDDNPWVWVMSFRVVKP